MISMGIDASIYFLIIVQDIMTYLMSGYKSFPLIGLFFFNNNNHIGTGIKKIVVFIINDDKTIIIIVQLNIAHNKTQFICNSYNIHILIAFVVAILKNTHCFEFNIPFFHLNILPFLFFYYFSKKLNIDEH